MRTFLWPAEDGWPYPDAELERPDPESEPDEDLLSLRVPPPHLLDDLEPLERTVLEGRFGLEGHPLRSVHQLCGDTGQTPAALENAMGSGLAKLRARLM
jgi:hypothetical protein